MSTKTAVPTGRNVTAGTLFQPPVIVAVAGTLAVVLLAALATPAVQSDQASKRAAFEKVIVMSSDELESKSLPELNSYRRDILDAANFGLGFFGNITGYSTDLQTHELDQVNALILKKADR
jgi:hypothetical protein